MQTPTRRAAVPGSALAATLLLASGLVAAGLAAWPATHPASPLGQAAAGVISAGVVTAQAAPPLAMTPAVTAHAADESATSRPGAAEPVQEGATIGLAAVVARLVGSGIVPRDYSVTALRALAKRAGSVDAAIRVLTRAHATGRTVSQVLAWGPVVETGRAALVAGGPGTRLGGTSHQPGYSPLQGGPPPAH